MTNYLENEKMRQLLEISLDSEIKALEELKYKEEEISQLKVKLAVYERRWEKILNFPPIRIILWFKNFIKGMR